MPLLLQVLEGDQFHTLAELKSGELLVIGRAPGNDLTFEFDSQMSSRHLQLKCTDDACQIEDLGSTNGTFINEERISTAKVPPGGSFRCGLTEFRITAATQATAQKSPTAAAPPPVAPAPVPVTAAPAAAAPPQSPEPAGVSMQIEGFLEETAQRVIDRFELELPIAPEPEEATEQYARRLFEGEHADQGMMFVSFALPKRAAVWWLTKCIALTESYVDDRDRELSAMTQKWVLEPSEALRRDLMAVAEHMEMETPVCWAAAGAFWAGGSIAPEDCPPVESPDDVFGKMISGGAIMASVFRQPENAPQKQREFTNLALQIAAGEIVLGE